MKRYSLWMSGLLTVLISLTSCTLYPKYKRDQSLQLAEWKVCFDHEIEAKDSQNFWELFKDPVLDDLVLQTLKNNYDIKVAIENVNTYIAKLGIVASKLYPQIEANAGAMREKIPSVLPKLSKTTKRIGYVYDFLLNTSYLADFWGEVRSARDASFHELQSSIENRKSVVLTLVSSIINSYFLMRQYDAQSLIAAETLQSRQEAYDLAVIRYDLGYTSILQVEQAIAEVESAKIAFEKIQISIGLIEDLISVLIGKPTTEIQRGLNLISLEMPKDVLTEIPSSILDQRPDLMAQEQLLMAANAQIGVAKSLFFPRFNLAGFLGVEKGRLSSLFQNNSSIWNYSLSILQEIFTGGRLTSNLKLTEAEKRKALHQYQSAILNAFKEVNDALISHKYNLEIVETQKIQVEALKKYLVISNLKYNEGQIDYLTFLDAERQLFQAELEQAAAIAQSFISFVNIYKAMGGNWVQKADLIATDSYKY